MANPEHLAVLKQGVKVWNEWRDQNPHISPDLEHANLKRADLNEADLRVANLDWANLSEARLNEADLVGAYLHGANLSEAYLNIANFMWAHLREADLTRAGLHRANFSRADLIRANLRYANLEQVHLSRARLENTIFSQARMGRTVIGEVDLTTAIGLDTVEHSGPSTIGIDTLYLSKGNIPDVFLRGAGVPDEIIALQSTLRGKPIEFYSVFISYSHADKSFARRLYDRLQGRGIRCWLDEHEILPGQKIHVEVDRGIRIWDKVLLCCSAHSLTSWWVNNEVELAIQKEQGLWKERGEETLSLIPLNLDGYMFKPQWRSGWKGQITERLAADFRGWEQDNAKFEAQFERVVRALRTGDGGREEPPKPQL